MGRRVQILLWCELCLGSFIFCMRHRGIMISGLGRSIFTRVAKDAGCVAPFTSYACVVCCIGLCVDDPTSSTEDAGHMASSRFYGCGPLVVQSSHELPKTPDVWRLSHPMRVLCAQRDLCASIGLCVDDHTSSTKDAGHMASSRFYMCGHWALRVTILRSRGFVVPGLSRRIKD